MDTARKREGTTPHRVPWMLREALRIAGLPSAVDPREVLYLCCASLRCKDKSITVTAGRQLEDVVRREPCGNRVASLWPKLLSSGRTE